MIHRQAEKYGDKVALKYRDYETAQWIPVTWEQFSQRVRRAANAMVALGIGEQSGDTLVYVGGSTRLTFSLRDGKVTGIHYGWIS